MCMATRRDARVGAKPASLLLSRRVTSREHDSSPGSVLSPLAFLCCHFGCRVVRCCHCAVLVWSRVLFSVTVSVVELAMATEVENNVPAGETKEIKEEAPADNKAEEAAAAGKQENAGDAPAAKEKEPAPPKVVVHKTNFEKDVVYLYQFSRTPLLPSLSPYCLKVETWLRLAGVKYEVSVTNSSKSHEFLYLLWETLPSMLSTMSRTSF